VIETKTAVGWVVYKGALSFVYISPAAVLLRERERNEKEMERRKEKEHLRTLKYNLHRHAWNVECVIFAPAPPYTTPTVDLLS
jgi:hypothetical protein